MTDSCVANVGCVSPSALRFICPVLLVSRAGRLSHNVGPHSANGSDLTALASFSSPRPPLFTVRNLLLPRICCLNLFVLCKFLACPRDFACHLCVPGSYPSSIKQKKILLNGLESSISPWILGNVQALPAKGGQLLYNSQCYQYKGHLRPHATTLPSFGSAPETPTSPLGILTMRRRVRLA